MRLVMVDPSLVCTGVVVASFGTKFSIESGREIKTSEKNDRPLRVYSIFRQLHGIIDEYPNIRGAVIEDYAFGNIGSVNSITPLAEAVGAMICAFSVKSIPIYRVASTTWKSVVGWKSMKKVTVAHKKEYLSKVKELYGIDCSSCDVADASMIALAVSKLLHSDGDLSAGAERLGEAIRNRSSPV
jgi:Holliday junction resolvasome RuvABC endonuclease subunit